MLKIWKTWLPFKHQEHAGSVISMTSAETIEEVKAKEYPCGCKVVHAEELPSYEEIYS